MTAMENGRIIAIDDDLRHLDSMCDLLAAHGLEVVATQSPERVSELVAEHHADVLILDLVLPQGSGIELLRRMRTEHPDVKVIVVSGDPNVANVAQVTRLGAYEYLPKPYGPEQLVTSVRNALAQRRLEEDNRRMQEQVAQSNRLHRYLVEKSPDVIYMLDHQGHFSFVNARAEEILACRREDLLGQHWSVLFLPEDLPRARHRFNERRTGSRATQSLELRVRRLQASDRPDAYIELTAMGVYREDADPARFSGTYGVARDITAKKATEELLEESQQRFLDMFEASPDPVFISRESDGEIIQSNDNYQHLAEQFEDGRAAGNDACLFADATARAAFVRTLQRESRGATFDVELKVAGEERFFHVKARLISVNGEACLLATLRDLTEHRRAERSRFELEGLLQDARKMITVGQLAGGIAHDFNNILASMVGYTELALLPASDTEARSGYLQQVIDAGARARDLVAQLLSFARTDTSDAQRVDVARLVTDNLDLLRAAIPAPISIDVDVPSDLPPVFIDPEQLRQVLISLFINGAEGMEGIGSLALEATRLRVVDAECASCQQQINGEYVALVIRDTGPEMERARLQHAFELFAPSPTGSQSTDVGLVLVHRIVHEYGGHVTVDQGDDGTRFSVLLPALAGEARSTPPRERAARSGGRILVVDDEVSVSSFVADVLRVAGHEVVVFNDAPSALTYAESHAAELSVCVTDQTMPRLTGLELGRALKALNPAIGVVLITGYAAVARELDAHRSEIDGLLRKPFRIEQLTRLIDEVLGRTATGRTDAGGSQDGGEDAAAAASDRGA